jgi:hypothetical protein
MFARECAREFSRGFRADFARALDERRPPFVEYAARRAAYALREVAFSTNGVQHI